MSWKYKLLHSALTPEFLVGTKHFSQPCCMAFMLTPEGVTQIYELTFNFEADIFLLRNQ